MVTLELVNEHKHEVGGSGDIKNLPLSKEVRVYIEDCLRGGYTKRDTILSIQKKYRAYMRDLGNDCSLSSNAVLYRDQMVHADNIYCTYNKIQENFYKQADD